MVDTLRLDSSLETVEREIPARPGYDTSPLDLVVPAESVHRGHKTFVIVSAFLRQPLKTCPAFHSKVQHHECSRMLTKVSMI